jgi:hypothetical protein
MRVLGASARLLDLHAVFHSLSSRLLASTTSAPSPSASAASTSASTSASASGVGLVSPAVLDDTLYSWVVDSLVYACDTSVSSRARSSGTSIELVTQELLRVAAKQLHPAPAPAPSDAAAPELPPIVLTAQCFAPTTAMRKAYAAHTQRVALSVMQTLDRLLVAVPSSTATHSMTFWNRSLHGWSLAGAYDRVWTVWDWMQRAATAPATSASTSASASASASAAASVEPSLRAMAPIPASYSIALDICGFSGDMARARALWQQLTTGSAQHMLQTNHYTSMVEALCRNRLFWDAVQLIASMLPPAPTSSSTTASASAAEEAKAKAETVSPTPIIDDDEGPTSAAASSSTPTSASAAGAAISALPALSPDILHVPSRPQCVVTTKTALTLLRLLSRFLPSSAFHLRTRAEQLIGPLQQCEFLQAEAEVAAQRRSFDAAAPDAAFHGGERPLRRWEVADMQHLVQLCELELSPALQQTVDNESMRQRNLKQMLQVLRQYNPHTSAAPSTSAAAAAASESAAEQQQPFVPLPVDSAGRNYTLLLTYNMLLLSYARAGAWNECVAALEQLLTVDRLKPNVVTVNNLLSAAHVTGQWSVFLSIWKGMLQAANLPPLPTASAGAEAYHDPILSAAATASAAAHSAKSGVAVLSAAQLQAVSAVLPNENTFSLVMDVAAQCAELRVLLHTWSVLAQYRLLARHLAAQDRARALHSADTTAGATAGAGGAVDPAQSVPLPAALAHFRPTGSLVRVTSAHYDVAMRSFGRLKQFRTVKQLFAQMKAATEGTCDYSCVLLCAGL